MASCKYHFILLILSFSKCLGFVLDLNGTSFFEAEENAKKLVASDDISHLKEKLTSYNQGYGKKWIAMPDGNGNALYSAMDFGGNEPDHWVYHDSITPENIDNHIKYILYTPEEPRGTEFQLNALNNLRLNKLYPIRIVSHGWMADSTSSIVQSIAEAYLIRGKNNVIAVDWKYFSYDIFYPSSAKHTSLVGKNVGYMIDELVEKYNLSYKDFHLIGHSLGAHVVGFAGSSVKQKVGRITGLDPALPGFQYVADTSGRLDDTDATFVDVIHTCAGLLGITIPAGHVDFYPNGGSVYQPGCNDLTSLPTTIQACSHSRSHEYFAESIIKETEFIGVKCKDWDHFKNHDCEDVYAVMGEKVKRDSRGIFYLKTNADAPYGLGMNGTIY